MHNKFSHIVDKFGSFDYKVRQVLFIIHKDNSKLPNDKKDQDKIQKPYGKELQDLLNKKLKEKETESLIKNHPNNDEIHFVIFFVERF